MDYTVTIHADMKVRLDDLSGVQSGFEDNATLQQYQNRGVGLSRDGQTLEHENVVTEGTEPAEAAK